MKLLTFILLFTVNTIAVIAQQDTLAPDWEKGLTWKVTSTTLSPNKALAKDNIVAYDTTYSNFLWEVMDINDTVVTLSILPLYIRMTSATPDTFDDSGIKEAFLKSKNSNTPIIYQSDLSGKLRKLPSNQGDSLSLYEIEEEKYIINDSALLQLYSEGTATENVEEYYDENEELYEEEVYNEQYLFMVQFFDKIIETIHSPYGEPYELDSIVDIKNFTKEKWDSYQKGLAELAKMMDISGNYQIIKENGELVYRLEMDMNLGNMMKELAKSVDNVEKKKNKKESKKAEKNLNDFKMNMLIKADYFLNESNHHPLKYTTEIQSNVSMKEENVSFSAFNELIFE